jgi:ribonuclease-3
LNLDDLDRRLGVTIDRGLLTQALTHSSFSYENDNQPNGERLEFLGDSVLGFVVTAHLFANNPDRDEAELTRMRLGVVSTEALDGVARELGLNDFLRLGRGQQIPAGKSKVLADAVEAIIGAAYVDGGIALATELIERFVLPLLDTETDLALNDAKSLLHAKAAAKKLSDPIYDTTFEGPTNDRTFFSTVTVGSHSATGTARSRKEAEKLAAAELLGKLG